MSIRYGCAVALILGFFLVACGGDDGGGGGGGGSGAGAASACNTYCDATVSCPLFGYTDAAECKSYECSGFDQAPAACSATFKQYYDCINAKPDVCDESGCTVDFNACM